MIVISTIRQLSVTFISAARGWNNHYFVSHCCRPYHYHPHERRLICSNAISRASSTLSLIRGTQHSSSLISKGWNVPLKNNQHRLLTAKPRTSGVEHYQTVSVNCNKCQTRLFRYKKKNGTKSNLVKCYIERIVEDSAGVLSEQQQQQQEPEQYPSPSPTDDGEVSEKKSKLSQQMQQHQEENNDAQVWECPSCGTQFARSAMIHGKPALKLVGGKTRMKKK